MDYIPTSPPRNGLEPDDLTSADQVTRHRRRGSISRYSGVESSQGPSVRDPFEPPAVGHIIQQQSSSVAEQRQNHNSDQNSPPQAVQHNTSRIHKDAESVPSRSNTKRSTTGVVEPGSEWAADRSPLQNLEVKLHDISKEEKRARVQEAEQRLRESLPNGGRRRTSVEIDTAAKQTSSRRVSADTGVRSRKESSGQHREVQGEAIFQEAERGPDTSPTEHGRIGGRNGTRSGKPSGSLQRDVYQQPKSQHTSPAVDQATSQTRTRRTSGTTAGVWESDSQLGRGVRFEGSRSMENPDQGPDSRLDQRAQRSNRPDQRATDGATFSRETQRLQKAGFGERESAMDNKPSRQIPTQQQELYGHKTEPSRDGHSAATYGGAPDPVPGHAVPGKNEANDYEIPPQTAAGIRSKQKVGFGSAQGDAIEPPARHRHHLSDILHHGEKNAVKQARDIDEEPRRLDEWRQGGTAQLTAVDYGTESSPATTQKAWWEGGRSGSQRRPADTKKDLSSGIKPLNGNYKDDYGTNQFSSSSVDLRSSMTTEFSPRVSGVRPYVGDEVLLKSILKKQPWRKDTKLLRSSYPGVDPDLSLSSAYSYSCPHLSEHDIYHIDHICKPYMSKELIKSMRSIRVRAAPKTDSFDPPLYLKCGPLLRYTGLKRDRQPRTSNRNAPSNVEREFWRGSVMIVTLDAESTYSPAPTLRVYPESMDLLPPPPQRVDGDSGYDLPAEYIDPIAGLPKLSRTGKTVYVKPVEDLEQEVDLSRVEDDTGLYEETRTAAVPTSYGTPDFRPGRGNPQKSASNNDRRNDSRKALRGQEIRGVRLHAERGSTFWRFNLEIELVAHEARIAYRINNSASVGFWVPAKGQTMNVMFHSCNGFSMSVKLVIIITC